VPHSDTPAASFEAAFAALLNALGLDRADSGGSHIWSGSDPYLPSPHKLGSYIGLAMLAAAHAAAALGKQRTGRSQDLSLALGDAAYGLNPEKLFVPRINGCTYSRALIDENPFLSHPYRTKDGQYAVVAGLYPKMVTTLLRFFGTSPDPRAVACAVGGYTGESLEEAAAMAGLAITLCRSRAAWLEHPQGRLLAATPVVQVLRVGDAPPRQRPAATRPLAGYRVLNFGRAFAGPIVGRTLAEQGADVLGITFPGNFEHEAVYCEANVGQRNCTLDLRQAPSWTAAKSLAMGADVIVNNFVSPRMAKWRLDPDSLAADHPGTVTVSISTFGAQGPWASRPGFDMNASAATGVMVTEGGVKNPRLPPSILAHDFVAGYLGAAGATAALRRQAKEGGTYAVRVNLARCAMWLQELGTLPAHLYATATLPPRPVPYVADTPLGRIERLASCVHFSTSPPRWRTPALVCRGSSLPQWETAGHHDGRPASPGFVG
jgi:crotonobetainyl-CoA:carnitine CoA-transferase CaiB-like acyl-CoA transferase